MALCCFRTLAFLTCGSFVLPAAAESVEILNSANFEQRILLADIVLVKFYAPWCGHCKAMAPAYEEAAQRLKDHSPSIPLASVDATKEPQLSSQQGVTGYPTLKIYRRGVASDYGGPRDADGIVAFMIKEAGGAPSAASGDSSTDTGGPLMARLCRDQSCNDPAFPIIDYSESENKCHCTGHPCWNDDGRSHACESAEHPHLSFTYNEEGKLQCGCRTTAQQYMSPYIAQLKCPGQHCDSAEFPFVDYNSEEKKCFCRTHPCHDLDGARHECNNPDFPTLLYREENQANGGVKKICECKQAIKGKTAEL